MNENEILKAKAMMEKSTVSAPEKVIEEKAAISAEAQAEIEMVSRGQDMSSSSSGVDFPAMTVNDFLSTANREPFVDVPWKAKGKMLKIKKFTKGDLDVIAAPLMKKTISVKMEQGEKAQLPTLDVSMEIFGKMEKKTVEIGMSYYKKDGVAVIDEAYIDKVMTDDVFKELSAIIQEVNPNALISSAKTVEDNENLKN